MMLLRKTKIKQIKKWGASMTELINILLYLHAAQI